MDIEKFSLRLMELMPIIIRGFSRDEHNGLSRGEITIPQFWALLYLSRQKQCLMSQLAKQLEISRPAATGLVDRLMAQGLVQREDDQTDRRVVKIRISTKGKKLTKNICEQRRRSTVKIFSKISAQERLQYISILEKIAKDFTPSKDNAF